MPELNKNHSARLRRVDTKLDRALDSLMQANGELWPTQLRPYGEKMQEAVTILQDLSRQIQADVSGTAAPAADADDGSDQPAQTDIEDFKEELDKQADDEPAATRTSRPRRSAA